MPLPGWWARMEYMTASQGQDRSQRVCSVEYRFHIRFFNEEWLVKPLTTYQIFLDHSILVGPERVIFSLSWKDLKQYLNEVG